MAVFVGGRALEAIEAVCNSPELAEDRQLQVDVLEDVEALVSQNLLQQREGRDGEPRFWMLETMQEYARDKLQESAEADALQREHACYFLALAEESESHLKGAKQAEWMNRLEEEHDNLRVALRWARMHGGQDDREAAEIGLQMAGALWRFWEVHGYFSEGREQLVGMLSMTQVINMNGSLKTSRAKALNGAGNLAWKQGEYITGRSLYGESLALRRQLGDKGRIADSLGYLGLLGVRQGEYVYARSLNEESLAIFRELGNKDGMAWSLIFLGAVAFIQSEYTSARALYEESLAIFRVLGEKRGIAFSLNGLGAVTHGQCDHTTAYSLYKESLAIFRELGNKRGIGLSLVGLGAVEVAVSVGTAQARAQRGARLLGTSEGLLEAIGAVMEVDDHVVYERARASARSQLSEEAFEKAWQEGRAMTIDQAIAYALEDTDE